MKYPRTPRDLWLNVKVTKEIEQDMRTLRKCGVTLEEIGEKYDVTHECVRLHVDPQAMRHKREVAAENERDRDRKATPEQRRAHYHRKIEVLGNKFRRYHNWRSKIYKQQVKQYATKNKKGR